MVRRRAPRPASQLTAAAAELSAKQREVFHALQAFPDGAQVAELSHKLGMHINTVRGHLDELIAQELVSRRQAHTVGRGRPSHIFTARVPRGSEVASEYIELVEMLTGMLADGDLEQAREIGQQWAAKSGHKGDVPEDLDEAAEGLVRLLRAMGFDPDMREDSVAETSREVGLRACPFIGPDGTLPDRTVGALHAGYIDGRAGELKVELKPFDRFNECGARITDPR
ncbi:metalloregulator ArsR/SmtB family transcription factor [Corynebacterium sp. HMSC074A01]|uniref:helix-turn-helix transcriptional regulator n=1 Tax=Corynebacterium sp. HMSC074A01 TaxID=1715030 RepID=UPI0008A52420|nr:hypothetical protein [Corynebacterium sp. HMSC074A01]OHF40386.1 hypothetical protein HMPREF2550_00850 [Corynebacterium sp. HMSC074A01]